MQMQQAKTGLWHMVGRRLNDKNLPRCQSYNLDKPNYLVGLVVDEAPAGAKVCQKCRKPN